MMRTRSRSSSISKTKTQRLSGDSRKPSANVLQKRQTNLLSNEELSVEDLPPISLHNIVTPDRRSKLALNLSNDLALPHLSDGITVPSLSDNISDQYEHMPRAVPRMTSDSWCDKSDLQLLSKITNLNLDNVFDDKGIDDTQIMRRFSDISLDQDLILVPDVQNKENISIAPSPNNVTERYLPCDYPPSSSSSLPPHPPPPARIGGVRQVSNSHPITDKDVLLGRGGLTNSHPGNQSFRAFVEQVKPMYHDFTTKQKKKEVSLLVVEDIERKGGRFLRNIKKNPNGQDKWVIASLDKARKKASQALREKRKKKGKK